MNKLVCVCLEEILAYSSNMDEYAENLRTVLQMPRDKAAFANMRKCTVARTEFEYLGHIIGAVAKKVDPRKPAALRHWQIPVTLTLVCLPGIDNLFPLVHQEPFPQAP